MNDWKFWVVGLLSLVVLGLAIANLQMLQKNADLRQLVNQRATFITQSQQLSQFNNQFIRALANLAAQTNDESIRQLLAENGVTFQVKPNAEATVGRGTDDE